MEATLGRAVRWRRAFDPRPWLTRDPGFLTLRFGAPETETAYIRLNAPKILVTTTRILYVIAAFAVLLLVVKLYQRFTGSSVAWGEEEGVDMELIWSKNAVHIVLALMCVGYIAFSRFGGFELCCSLAAVEYSVVSLVIVGLVAACFTDWWYLSKMLGRNPSTTHFTDSYVLLLIDTVITVSHLALPIRWIVLLPLDATGVLLYGVLAFGLGSPEPNAKVSNWFLLTGLVVCAAIGKRAIEHHDRNLFLTTLNEKTLRAQLEFKLSERSTPESPPKDYLEVASSAPTLNSGPLWNDASRAADDPAMRLHHIAEVGCRERWLIPTQHVELVPNRLLGAGSYGVVVAGLLHGTPVAIKMSRDGSSSWSCLGPLTNELRILRHVRNPNIVQFHGACVDPASGELAVVEELVEGPSLEKFLVEPRGSPCTPPEDTVRHHLVFGFCRGLQYLHAHEPCIVHGDLKPSNVRVEQMHPVPRVKILDFGLSRLLKGNPKPLGGTLRYMAPEIVSSRAHSATPLSPHPAADVFSFGRLLYFIALGAAPLRGYSNHELEAAARREEVLPQHWPSGCSDFAMFCAPIAERCLSKESTARPHIKDIHNEFIELYLRPGASGGDQDQETDSLRGGESMYPCAGHVPWHVGLQSVRAAVGQISADFSALSLHANSAHACCEPGSTQDSSPTASLCDASI